jgi:N-acetylgalactosamine-6-sulfatase
MSKAMRNYWRVAMVVVLLATTSAWAASPPRLNVVFILTDNLGYADLGCYGARDIRTPNIDRLASEGVRFTQFYSNAPDCTPSRTALLTGRYQHRVGGLECAIGIGNVGRYEDAIRLAKQHDLGLPASETTIVRLLKQAGYQCVGFGKWHLGYEKKFLPPAHGFDYYLGLLSGCEDYFYHRDPSGAPVLFENNQVVTREGYTTDLFTDKAVEFITAQGRKKPFFLYLPYNAPSAPFQHPRRKPPAPIPPGPWTSPAWQNGTRETLAAIIERLDHGIGRVLRSLEDAKLADNTLVIFTNDNGAYPIAASNAPLRGNAHELFEGGIRVACIARWPGRLPKGLVCDRLTMMFDLTRSIASATGVKPPPEQPFDGIDILDDIVRQRPEPARTLFWRAKRGHTTWGAERPTTPQPDRIWRAVRQGPLKYISRQDGDQLEEYLFDIPSDVSEKNNLMASRPRDAQRLKALLADWEREVHPKR